jgi:16S rRNA (uracil1498-N3)-methyltransferase
VACTELRGHATSVDAVGSAGARILIGPEGGLTDAEIDGAVAHRLTPISLGPWTLRTEVAVVAALSRLLSACGQGHGHGHEYGPGHGDGHGHGDAR